MANFDFLLGSQTDPMRQMGQFMTLAQLSRQNRMGQEDENARNLDRQSDMLAANAYTKARQSGDFQGALAELSQQGEAGALATRKLVDFAQKQAKSEADVRFRDTESDAKRAGAEKDRASIKLDGLKQFANLGTAIASGQAPVNETTQGAAYEIARAVLPPDVVRTMPADPARFKEWMTVVASPESLSKIMRDMQDIEQSKATTAKTKVETEQLPAELGVRQRNADSQRISANASTTSAGAAASNAATARERLTFDRTKETAPTWSYDATRGIQIDPRTGASRPVVDAGGQPIGQVKDSKQATQSQRALAVVDQAEQLIGKATGSYAGAGVDQGARVFGKSTEGAQAIAELKVLEGALISNQPRMEGPQSDKDVLLYKQMAGQIGDPTVPAEQKRAALRQIRALNEKYAAIDGNVPAAGKPALPKLGERRDGYLYKGGDPAAPSSWEKL